MAHNIWKDNIKLMLNSCHDCWSYKAIKYAFEANQNNFDPDNNVFSALTFNEVCSISFNNNNKRPLTPKSMPPAGDEHSS